MVLKRVIAILFVLFVVSGCASQSATEKQEDQSINQEFNENQAYDPLEGFNRAMWAVNFHFLDPYFLRPVSVFYADYVPSFIRTGIRNFINNLGEPASTLNSLFMMEGQDAVHHFNRFWINSTFGIAGLFDIASLAEIPQPGKREFGDTMGYYGIDQGPYFMIPGYGPTTLREGTGDVIDGLYPPLSLLNLPQSILRLFVSGIENRAAFRGQEQVLYNSPDPYVFVRDAYLQNKAFTARGGKDEEPEEDPEYIDEALLDEIDGF